MFENPDTLLTQLSRHVQAFVQATGISQRKLAKLIKTDQSHLSSFLAGRTGLSAEKSLKLMQILNASRQQLEMKLGRSTTAQIEHFQANGEAMRLDNGGGHWVAGDPGAGTDPNNSTDITNTITARNGDNADDYQAATIAFLRDQQNIHRSAIAEIQKYLNQIPKARPNPNGPTEPARKIDDNTASRTPGPRPDRFAKPDPARLLAYLREDRARAASELALERQIARERGLRNKAQLELAELRKEKRLSL